MATAIHIFAAAIDFGTTYSGYAFSSRDDFNSSPLNISCMTWSAGSGCLQSLKSSTCVLFNSKGEFDSFGFEAEDKYSELAYEDNHTEWYFFRRFKMMLYNEKHLRKNIRLKAMNGKQMDALKVFSSSIRYLKNHLENKCENQGFSVEGSDIKWVLTVPAIWTEPAKQFMREAAVQAGIPNNMLILALEPEAASVFCKHIPVESMVEDSAKKIGVFRSGTKYMVMDAGGGTIDVTVHEVQKDESLKEIYKASGGNWGGTSVDDDFEELLSELSGSDVYSKFKTECIGDLLELYRSFEVKKRSLSRKMEGKVTFKLPVNLQDLYKECHPEIDVKTPIKCNAKNSSDVIWQRDKLRLSADLTCSLFKKSLRNILDHLDDLLSHSEVRDITAILMVGGYSDCPLLQDAVISKFSNLKVIIPKDAGLAVLKGAVITGHRPDIMTERICRFTYGVSCGPLFKEGIHREDYKFTNDIGEVRCCNIFDSHVAVGDIVKTAQPQPPRTYTVHSADDIKMNINVFASTVPSPMYTTDDTCTKLGTLTISMPDTSRGHDRGVVLTMVFGSTEIKVEAVDKHTKEKHSAFFDLLG